MCPGRTSQVLRAAPHRTAPLGSARPLPAFLSPAAVQTLHLREPGCRRAAPGLLHHCVLCITVLISTDNIPADPRFQSCRLEGQNFSPSSPRRLIRGFTSSALRKFNCNLGLDKYSYYKRLVQLDNLILVQGFISGSYSHRQKRGKKTRNVVEMSE